MTNKGFAFRRRAVLGQLALVFALFFAITLPAEALVKAGTVAAYFFEGRASDEPYARIRRDDAEDDDSYEDTFREVEVLRRLIKTSVTVSKDVNIIQNVQVTVGKNATLTIDKGATLTIYGELVVSGKLVNNGTIIVGTKNGSKDDEDIDKDTMEDILYFMQLRSLDNKGSVTNNGKITIRNGCVSNSAGASIKNTGVMTISNTEVGSAGLKNIGLKKNGVTTSGTVTNDGTINLENTKGYGIHNYSGAKFTNNGTIAMAKLSTVKGTISGKQPVKK